MDASEIRAELRELTRYSGATEATLKAHNTRMGDLRNDMNSCGKALTKIKDDLAKVKTSLEVICRRSPNGNGRWMRHPYTAGGCGATGAVVLTEILHWLAR